MANLRLWCQFLRIMVQVLLSWAAILHQQLKLQWYRKKSVTVWAESPCPECSHTVSQTMQCRSETPPFMKDHFVFIIWSIKHHINSIQNTSNMKNKGVTFDHLGQFLQWWSDVSCQELHILLITSAGLWPVWSFFFFCILCVCMSGGGTFTPSHQPIVILLMGFKRPHFQHGVLWLKKKIFIIVVFPCGIFILGHIHKTFNYLFIIFHSKTPSQPPHADPKSIVASNATLAAADSNNQSRVQLCETKAVIEFQRSFSHWTTTYIN